MPGGHPTSPSTMDPTPMRVCRIAYDLCTRNARQPHWLYAGFVVLERPPSDASPFSASRLHSGITATQRALRHHWPATALPFPNQSAAQNTTGQTRHDRPDFVLPPAGTAVPGGTARRTESGASLEVFVPFNARWPRSRCPGRPASGRSRFDVGSSAGPRCADLPARLRPCGFSLQRTHRNAPVWRACGPGVPVESIVRSIGRWLPL
jgi:hypothetical protein